MSNYFNHDYQKSYQSHVERMTEKSTKKSSGAKVDLKSYFSLTLPDGEESGTKIIRILPPQDMETLWNEVWYHDQLVVYKNKPKLYDFWKNEGKPNPLYEMYKLIYENTTFTKEQKKEEGRKFLSRLYYVFRVIERGKENEGVKFWRFVHNLDKDGIMDKLQALFNRNPNWVHPIKGIDIELTISKMKYKRGEGFYYKIISVAKHEECPLHTDENVMVNWIEDKRTFKDMYKIYPFEYLELVAQGKLPKWDQETGTYIEAREPDNSEGTEVIDDVDTDFNVDMEDDDYSETTTVTSDVEINEISEDDLPF